MPAYCLAIRRDRRVRRVGAAPAVLEQRAVREPCGERGRVDPVLELALVDVPVPEVDRQSDHGHERQRGDGDDHEHAAVLVGIRSLSKPSSPMSSEPGSPEEPSPAAWSTTHSG